MPSFRGFTATIEGIDNGFILSAGSQKDREPVLRTFFQRPDELRDHFYLSVEQYLQATGVLSEPDDEADEVSDDDTTE